MFSKTARVKHRSRRPAYCEQSTEEIRQTRDRFLFGSLGAASPVRRIDPKTGAVVEVIKAKTNF